MLTVDTTDVDPEGNETIWFGGKVCYLLSAFVFVPFFHPPKLFMKLIFL